MVISQNIIYNMKKKVNQCAKFNPETGKLEPLKWTWYNNLSLMKKVSIKRINKRLRNENNFN